MFPNDEYIKKLKNQISESLSILDQSGIRDDHIRWGFIKSEIRQFSITFSNNLSKPLNPEREILEKELKVKDFEKFGLSYFDNEDYLPCKTRLDKIYDKKVEVLESGASATGTKKEKNLLNSS